MNKLRVLVACETSGTVRDAFLKAGHDAVSCDILPHDSGKCHLHYQRDVIDLLEHYPNRWDLMIAHPPCTYLCNSGVSWLFRYVDSRCVISRFVRGGAISRAANWARVDAMKAGAKLFNALLHCNHIPYIAVENPVQHGWARSYIRKQDQVIQPYMFGHPESKATCLWLKNLPQLKETNNVKKQWRALPPKQRNRLNWLPPSPQRWKLRSKTYDGIAQAMVDQWAPFVSQAKEFRLIPSP